MTGILGALGSGYTAHQVLRYLSQHNPRLASQISAALNAGHTIEHVMNFMARNEKKLGKLIPQKEQTNRSDNLYKTAKNELHTSLIGGAKALGTTAAIAGSAYALSHAIPRALQAGIPQIGMTQMNQPMGPGPNSPGVQVLGGQPPPPNAPPNTAQPTNPVQPNNSPALANISPTQNTNLAQGTQPISNAVGAQTSSPSQPPMNQPTLPQPTDLQQSKEIPTMETREDILWDALQKGKTKGPDDATSGMLKLAKQMMTTGQIKSKEDFDRFSQIFTEKMSQSKSLPKALREAGNEFASEKKQNISQEFKEPEKWSARDVINESLAKTGKGLSYAKAAEIADERNVQKTPTTPQEQPSLEPQGAQLDVSQETPKIEPKSTVVTPEGIGEVKAIRNGKAIVEVDGKKHQIDEDELIASPLPEKDLADLFNDVISGIEKETGLEVSKNVDWAGYDPKSGELAYKPHGGDKLYVYDDISPEDAEQLTSLLTLRKTSGENHIGAWESNTKSPIGAAMSKLIRKLQTERGGKGNEYKNRYETLYDALEPAKSAAKRKHAELKKKAKAEEIKEKPKKEAKPREKKKSEKEILESELETAYDKLTQLSEKMQQENRNEKTKKIDPQIRSEQLKLLDARQKRVDDLIEELTRLARDKK